MHAKVMWYAMVWHDGLGFDRIGYVSGVHEAKMAYTTGWQTKNFFSPDGGKGMKGTYVGEVSYLSERV